ncbi:MAG: PilW family protein [Endozoicomonas sp. (ex Botrylloides leachii)]|nr:PilW family protein [Endozoicomonas sp. (ex Botrylloides leachii)]
MFFSNLMTSNFHETRALAKNRAQHAFFLMGNDIREAGSGTALVGPGSYHISYNTRFSGSVVVQNNQGISGCKGRCNNDASCTGFSWASSFIVSDTGAGQCRLGSGEPSQTAANGWVTYLKLVNRVFYIGNCGGAPCTQEGLGNRSDTIAVVLDPYHDQDCVGQNVIGPVINRYFISADLEGKNGLFCQSYFYPSGGVKAPPQLMVEGVEQLQLLYGYADNGGERATSYRTANAVTNWGYVRAVQIGFLVGGGYLWGDNTVLQSRSYNLLGSSTLTLTDREPRYPFTMLQSIFTTHSNTNWREKQFFEVD